MEVFLTQMGEPMNIEAFEAPPALPSFRERTGAEAVTGVAGDLSFGKIQQGYLESSNVDPVKEITNMITAQRAFEMNSKVIQAADEMAGTVSKGIR